MASNAVRRRLQTGISSILILAYFVFSLFPILWMIVVSLKRQSEIFTTRFIFSPTLDNYMTVLFGQNVAGGTGAIRTDFGGSFINSLIISVTAVLISLVVGVPAAYALARFDFKGKNDLAFTFLSLRFAPELLVIIPLFIIYHKLGLYNTYTGLIWVYQLICMPLIIWVVRGYFEDIPPELEYAAQVDGYSWWHVFFKVLLPLVSPGIAAASLLAFIFAWNNFVFAMLLGGAQTNTVTVSALSFLAAEQARYGEMAAASVIAALPEVLLALGIQKYLIRGLSFGAVKG
ncbi:MAG TPA: carbohydrate ABC transporter permease [Symbiobacteriaceae bacterium]|nr:carbohydrate ABC transporter permease [Symbiobacteriaceae bacterium]